MSTPTNNEGGEHPATGVIMPGLRFKPGVYKPQFGSSNPQMVAGTADAAYEATLLTSFNAIQVLIAGVQLGPRNGASGAGRTDAAQAALLAVSNATLVSAATIASLGLITGPYSPWFGAVDWTAGLAACQALLPSL
jgi:hypothetical protein